MGFHRRSGARIARPVFFMGVLLRAGSRVARANRVPSQKQATWHASNAAAAGATSWRGVLADEWCRAVRESMDSSASILLRNATLLDVAAGALRPVTDVLIEVGDQSRADHSV